MTTFPLLLWKLLADMQALISLHRFPFNLRNKTSSVYVTVDDLVFFDIHDYQIYLQFVAEVTARSLWTASK